MSSYRAIEQVTTSAGGCYAQASLIAPACSPSFPILDNRYTLDNGIIYAPDGSPVASGTAIPYPVFVKNQKSPAEYNPDSPNTIGGLDSAEFFKSYPPYFTSTDSTGVPQVYLLPSDGQCPPSSVIMNCDCYTITASYGGSTATYKISGNVLVDSSNTIGNIVPCSPGYGVDELNYVINITDVTCVSGTLTGGTIAIAQKNVEGDSVAYVYPFNIDGTPAASGWQCLRSPGYCVEECLGVPTPSISITKLGSCN
jgi:hypothetical protein